MLDLLAATSLFFAIFLSLIPTLIGYSRYPQYTYRGGKPVLVKQVLTANQVEMIRVVAGVLVMIGIVAGLIAMIK